MRGATTDAAHGPLHRPPLRRQRERLLPDVGHAKLPKPIGHPFPGCGVVRTAGDASPILVTAVTAAPRDRRDRVDVLLEASAVERRVRALRRWQRPPRKRLLEVVQLAERYQVAREIRRNRSRTVLRV